MCISVYMKQNLLYFYFCWFCQSLNLLETIAKCFLYSKCVLLSFKIDPSCLDQYELNQTSICLQALKTTQKHCKTAKKKKKNKKIRGMLV